MVSGETKFHAGRPPGAATTSRPNIGGSRDLPHRHTPPPPRHPPPHASNERRAESRSDVRAREEADEAGRVQCGSGVARRDAEHGMQEATGSAEAREARISHGLGRKRFMSPPPPAHRQPKWRAVRPDNRAPPDWCKDSAVPLGRSRPRAAGADGAAVGSSEKPTPPPPPLAGSRKQGVLTRVAATSKVTAAAGDGRPLPVGDRHGADATVVKSSGAMNRSELAAGTSKMSAVGDTPPMAVCGRHGADSMAVKSSCSLHWSELAAADCLPDTGSRGTAGYMLMKGRGRAAETGELQAKEPVPSTRLLPKVQMVSAAHQRHLWASSGSNSESVLDRGSREARLPLEAENADGASDVSKGVVVSYTGSFAAGQEVMGTVVSSSSGAKKKEKALDYVPIKVVNLDSEERLGNGVVFNLEYDDVLRAAAICEEKLILYTGNSSYPPPLRRQRQHKDHKAHDRRKFKMICRRFEFICTVLVHGVEEHLLNLVRGRIDYIASKAMKKLPDVSEPGPIEGEVPGVEVGDEFMYKVQLAIVGLHRKILGGIDWTYKNGTPVAISIVCSGTESYPNEMLGSGELIYIGSGGKPAGNKHDKDQQLKGGNLALDYCIRKKTPVRVIYGIESLNEEGHNHSRIKRCSKMYIYDGLYRVVDSCEHGEQGSMMFMYKLKKIPGQPELPLRITELMRKPKMR